MLREGLKELDFNVAEDDYVEAYLKLFQGLLKFTDQELKVTVELIKHYIELVDHVEEPFLSELLAQRRTKVRNKMKLSAQNFTNVLGRLKEKGVFIGENNTINPMLIPCSKVVFSFNILQPQAKQDLPQAEVPEKQENIEVAKPNPSTSRKRKTVAEQLVEEEGVISESNSEITMIKVDAAK